jgi:hypothetical protein
MSKYRLTKEDLTNHLREQIDFMIASAIQFDNGFEGEAKRLSIAIRILVHDTSRCSALLTQLNKMNILFYDSASVFNPRNLATSNCLTVMRATLGEKKGSGGDYIAPLDDLAAVKNEDRKVSFDRWWRRNIIYRDNSGSLFTRRDLVLNVADKEGGAHVDPELDQAYANLAKFNSLGWKVYVQGEEKDFANSPVLPSIRQIAHEILKTLKDGTLDLFTDKNQMVEKFIFYQNHCQTFAKTPIKEA